MAADRKIQTGIQVIPQKYITTTIPAKSSSSRTIAAVEGTLENVDLDRASYSKTTSSVSESTYNRWKLDADVNKTFGHSAIVDNNVSQDWDGWTSMEHPQMYWEMHDGNDTDTDGQWDSATSGEGIWWNGTALVTSSASTQLSNQTELLKYCYIRNVGDANLFIALITSAANRYRISAGRALAFRGDGGAGRGLQANQVWANTDTSDEDTYIEFVIAI